MDKLKLHTPDFAEANAAKLAELFPNCVTETKAEDGPTKRAIDFDLLRQELSKDLVEGPQERYRLDWPGKRESLALANAPINKTLRPCKEESVDFDTTQNLYIEGDNLDALKLLQETYLGKVKMIYIDPPYNTGNDFIYDDNFSMSREEYEGIAGARDEAGNAMFDEEKWKQNSNASGRFHSEWLSMIYPRLKLARNLLCDTGVVFVSIDDGEVANLRRVLDEVFGADNFLASFIWKKMDSPSRNDESRIASEYHDYVVAYLKSKGAGGLSQMPKPDIVDAYPIKTDDGRLGRRRQLRKNGKSARREDRPTMWYELEAPDGSKVLPYAPPPDQWEGRWALSKATWLEREAAGETEWIERDYGWVPYVLEFAPENPSIPWPTLWDDLSQNRQAKAAFTALMAASGATFDNPKPVDLLVRLCQMATRSGDLVLDFFSGSATTSHAVMRLNADDGMGRRHIAIQLPEPCEENSDAFKAGFKTIAEIGKERIRRAGNKIRNELEEKLSKELKGSEEHASLKSCLDSLDTGFRVLKVDSSNMADVYYQPDQISQEGLALQIDNVKEGREPEDLLFQVLLDWGVDLGLPITEEKIEGKKVFFVAGNALAACFDTGLSEDFCKSLAKREPLRAVFRDSGYASDSTKINIEQILKALSPNTELKTL